MLSHCSQLVSSANRCESSHLQTVEAPLELVWSLVRRFDKPQLYKGFVRSCTMRAGDGGVGSVREVRLVSGLPARTSTERLDDLDDGRHLIRFTVVGGDHRLANYESTMTLRDCGGGATIVRESYAVDIPSGSSAEETRIFADTIVRCNLRSLAQAAQKLTVFSPPTS